MMRLSPFDAVHVPKDFLGMCVIRYPQFGSSPAGVLKYGSARMCQLPETRWNAIEKSAGVYDQAALERLDSLITHHRQNGASVYFGLYGTPVFYASDAPHPVKSDKETKGPWGGFGECANPISLDAVAGFVSMIVRRYNKPGGVWFDLHGHTLGKGIQYWETWNEPEFNDSNSGGFFWGSAAQMVDLAQVQFSTIKGIDPSVVVTSPGFHSPISEIGGVFLTTKGASGKTGAECCDAYAFHPYYQTPPGVKYGTWTQDIANGRNGIVTTRKWLKAHGLDLPLWISEWGLAAEDNIPLLKSWYLETDNFRYKWMARFLMACAAYGVKCVHPWHWEMTSSEWGISGNWQKDVSGVQRAYNDIANKVSGKTITGAVFTLNGVAELYFSDNSRFVV